MFKNEDNQALIRRMTKERITKLLFWLMEENKKSKNPLSVDEVGAKFYSSRTFMFLMNPDSDLYYAPISVLKQLIIWEYTGNTFDWERQVFA